MIGTVGCKDARAGWRWALCARPAAIALCLVLGGCAGDDEEPPSTATKEDFPNLASVPDEPPPSTPKVEREKLIQGLQADRANAEYTDQALGEAAVNVAPAEPPPPGPPKPEAAESEEGSTDEAEAEEAEAEEEAPTVTTPAEVAALPANLGEPTALIYFAGDTANLTDHDRAILTDVAKAYTQQRGNRVRVIGHASSGEAKAPGGEEEDLASARADAVAETLIALGVPANALETSTGGATYDESQPNGAAANRRVEVYIGS
jgi:outer membrane protein OmpA-like peptidoglycan-associated protein